ncbi:MAG: diacylglycerol kinase [Myxococcota bacterium]
MIRVIQWSTGNVGKYALRAIIHHPELELAGLFVSSEAKEGKDAGELCGVDPVGIKATRDIDALLNTDADAVCYTADAGMRPGDAIDDMAKILASGKNVVSCSMVGLVHPTTLNDMFTSRLTEACESGGTSFLTSGIDPGFANDVLPLVISGLSEHWSQIRVQEVINYATYNQPETVFDIMGFAKAMDHTPVLLMPGMLSFAWGGTLRLLAEGLGITLDEIREVHERRPATKALQIGPYTVEEGTVAALRFEVQGMVDGKAALIVEHVTRLDDELAPEWPTSDGAYRVIIEGVPSMKLDYEFADEHGDHAVGGVLLTATRIVNAIPAVCAAPTGLLSALDIPMVTGKGLYKPA